MRGLFKTHNINFPIAVDQSGIFSKFEEKREIILIDISNTIIKNYRFPLSPNERELFMQILSIQKTKGEGKND